MKIIFLILANDTDYYLKMQELLRKYMNTHKNIKSYFIKYNLQKLHDDKDIFIDDDTIYIKGSEESFIPGCLDKTIKSIEYILKNEDFDYLIRTNMSSVWDLNKIYNLVLSNNFLAAGVIGYENNKFISGAGLLLKKNICKILIQNKNDLNYNIIDDVSIGDFLINNNINFNSLARFEVFLYENKLMSVNYNLIKNHYHYRCKSNNHNETINNMKHIINLIYKL